MTPDEYLPVTDEERQAVWEWLSRMVSHPDCLYDRDTVADVRKLMATYLAGYRSVGNQ